MAFFSDIDNNEFINNLDNLAVCDFNTVANIEPAIIGIYLLPVGSDLQLVSEEGKITFWDNMSGEEVELNTRYNLCTCIANLLDFQGEECFKRTR